MKICIIGASAGIGEALSRLLAREGHLVWGVGRRGDQLEKLARDLGEDSFIWSAGDISSREDTVRIKRAMDSRGFSPDAVIISAAIFGEDLHDNRYDFKEAERVFDVNIHGTMHGIEMFLDDFLARKKGHFILLSSIAAFRPNPRGIAYGASKAAVSRLAKGFDLAMRGRGVLFSSVYLGPVATDMWEGKVRFPVISPAVAARKISKILSSRRATHYIPFFSTFLARISSIVPERVYARLSVLLFK